MSVVPQAAPAPAVPNAGAAAAQPPARPASFRYQSLDLWRGVACLLVVVYHSAQVGLAQRPGVERDSSALTAWAVAIVEWTNLGVPMFFVISGCCIAAAADGLRRSNRSIGTYFVRRFRRIFPPLWIAIAFLLAFFVVFDYLLTPGLISDPPWSQPRPWRFSPWQWLGNLSLTESWRYHLVGGQRGHFPTQAWTLCFEEQFYAVTGLLLLFFRRRFFLAAAICTALTGVVAGACHWAGVSVAGFFFDGKWGMFAAGIGVYYALNYATLRGKVMLGALLAVATGAAVFLAPQAEVVDYSFAFGFALLILALYRWDLPLVRSPLARPLLFCGMMCYSLYLVHLVPVKALSQVLYRGGLTSVAQTVLVTIPSCLMVSILLGYLFYLLIERRFLNTWQRSHTSLPLQARPVGAIVLAEPQRLDQREPVFGPASLAMSEDAARRGIP